jgi:hypothetical protein
MGFRQCARSASAACAALALAAAAHAQMSNVTTPPEQRAPESERSWQAAASVFAAYDSNIGLTEEEAPAGFAYEGGLRAGVLASASWRLLEGERAEGGIAGFLTQTTTQGDRYADEYDLTTVNPRAWAALKLALGERAARVQIDYGYRRDWLEGDDFERRHATRLSARLALSERLDVAIHYGVDLKEFDAVGFHVLDARRDAEHHRTGAQLRWLSEEGRSELSFGYEFLRNLAEQPDFDFDGHGIAGRLRTQLPIRIPIGLDVLASYADVDYERFSPAPRREARTQQYRTALIVPLTPQLVAETSYAYLRVGAEQARFRSQRHLVTSALSYRF